MDIITNVLDLIQEANKSNKSDIKKLQNIQNYIHTHKMVKRSLPIDNPKELSSYIKQLVKANDKMR